MLPDCTHFSPFFSRQVESQAGGGNQAGSGPQTPGCPLQLESETHQNRYFHIASGLNCVRSGNPVFERDSQLDDKNFSQGKGANDNVWTLCGRRNLNRKKRYIRHQHQTEAQWPIGYGVGLRIKRSSVRIRPWPLR